MSFDLQTLLGGLYLGALYGTAAVGFQVVLGSSGRVHLAYGHMWIAWALLLSSVHVVGSVPLPAVLPVMVAAGWFVGWFLHPVVLWRGPLSNERATSFFLITLGAALVIEDAGSRLWPLPGTAMAWAPEPFVLAGVTLPRAKLALMGAALITSLGVHLFLKRNRWGMALRAWDRGRAPVYLAGVSPESLGRRAAGLGFALSALAGGFLALSYTVSIREGMAMTVRALVLAVLGGTLSPLGVLGLGMGMGVGEAFVGQVLGMRWGPAVGYGLLLFLLPVLERRRT
ncbi:MAG: ABC transporter permease subunit [Thermodesulfobacteriota bacterium]